MDSERCRQAHWRWTIGVLVIKLAVVALIALGLLFGVLTALAAPKSALDKLGAGR